MGSGPRDIDAAGEAGPPRERRADRSRGADMREFAIAIDAVNPTCVALHIAGELDITTAPRLRERLDHALDAGVRSIVVDLTHVTFIDSISLAVLVAARSRLGPDGRLAVVARTPFVRLVLEASGLDGVLDVFTDRREARAFAFG